MTEENRRDSVCTGVWLDRANKSSGRNRGGVEFHLEWKRYVKRFHLSLPVVDNSVCRGNFFFFLPFFLFYSRRLVRGRGGEGGRGRSGAVGVILEYRA